MKFLDKKKSYIKNFYCVAKLHCAMDQRSIVNFSYITINKINNNKTYNDSYTFL